MEPLTISIGPFTLSAWGLFMLLALATGAGLFWWGVIHFRLNPDKAIWLFLGALSGGIIGGKLSMIVFLGPQLFFSHLPELARSGMAHTGALIGGYLGVRITERVAGMPCRCDLFVLPIPLMQAIGRLGNFFAVDAYGTPTDLPWAVDQAGAMRHPVQLYEAGLDLVLFAVLLHLRGRFLHREDLFRVYLLSYALIRFPLEFLRYQPTPRDLFGLTLVQQLCLLAIVTAGGWLIWSLAVGKRRQRLAVLAASASREAAAVEELLHFLAGMVIALVYAGIGVLIGNLVVSVVPVPAIGIICAAAVVGGWIGLIVVAHRRDQAWIGHGIFAGPFIAILVFMAGCFVVVMA